jgi:hypothetical protein
MIENPRENALTEARVVEIINSLRENVAALDALGLQIASAHISLAIELLEDDG